MRKINRILKNEEFTLTLNLGKKYKVQQFLIAFRPNNYNHLRVGISVSRKVGGAVERVRIRRQIRAMVNELNILDKPIDVVIIPKPDFKKMSFSENSEQLKKLFSAFLNSRRDK